MSKIRYFIRLSLAYISHFKGIIFTSVIIGFILFFVFRIVIPNVFQSSHMKVGITGRFRTDDLPNEILSQMSNGLTKLSPEGIPEPDLATSWETPDRGKTWIFHLNGDRLWHDSTKVISEHINYEFSDVEIERPDDTTLIFKLKDPFAPFPTVVSKPTFKQGLIGVGNWKVEKLVLAGDYLQRLVLKNSENNKITYKFYPTVEGTKLAYKIGEIDYINETLDPTPFDSWNTSSINKKILKNQVVILFYNTQDKFLSDKNLRQALTYAIKKEQFGERALSPFNPDSWAYNPQVKPYTFDEARAKELLDEVPDELKNDMQINLVTSTSLLTTAEVIARDWNNLGVKTNVTVSPIVPSEFQTFLTILDIPKDPDQYPLWHSTQTGTNISKYSDLRIDKLLEEGRTQLDFEERKKIYLDFQRFLLEDLPAAFLYHPTYFIISRR